VARRPQRPTAIPRYRPGSRATSHPPADPPTPEVGVPAARRISGTAREQGDILTPLQRPVRPSSARPPSVTCKRPESYERTSPTGTQTPQPMGTGWPRSATPAHAGTRHQCSCPGGIALAASGHGRAALRAVTKNHDHYVSGRHSLVSRRPSAVRTPPVAGVAGGGSILPSEQARGARAVLVQLSPTPRLERAARR
jgi:hypothetical protein